MINREKKPKTDVVHQRTEEKVFIADMCLKRRRTTIRYASISTCVVVQRPNGLKPVVNEGTEKEISRETSEESFELVEISKEDIFFYRRGNIPSFILKVGSRYFHAIIRADLNLLSQNKLLAGTHMCGKCDRLSAATDRDGGCAKVRDYHESYIENYNWITQGYETFNVDDPAFVVVSCEHYKPYPLCPSAGVNIMNLV